MQSEAHSTRTDSELHQNSQPSYGLVWRHLQAPNALPKTTTKATKSMMLAATASLTRVIGPVNTKVVQVPVSWHSLVGDIHMEVADVVKHLLHVKVLLLHSTDFSRCTSLGRHREPSSKVRDDRALKHTCHSVGSKLPVTVSVGRRQLPLRKSLH